MERFTTTILQQSAHTLTVRAELVVDEDTEVVEYTLDASDGSELEASLRVQGGLGLVRLGRLRVELQQRAREKAQNLAKDRLIERRFTDEERAERASRRPMQPMSAGLRRKLQQLRQLAKRIDNARD